MAEVAEFSPLNAVRNEKKDWKVRVKVVDSWVKTAYKQPEVISSYELIVADSQGHKMRTSIYKNLMQFFEHTFKLDVVGQLVTMNRYKVVEEGDTKKRYVLFQLQDPTGEKVRCKIWGDHAEKLYNSQLQNQDKKQPQIVWLHNYRMKDWEAAQQQPGYEHPVIDINLEMDVSSALEKFTDPEVCTFVVRGTVKNLPVLKGGINLIAPAVTKSKCKGAVTDVFLKIRATIHVQDKTGGCDMVLFDGQLSKMINRSVQWLNTTAKSILHKEYAFIVKHSLYGDEMKYSGYTVCDMTVDLEVIKSLNEKLIEKEAEYDVLEDGASEKAEDNIYIQTPQAFKEPKIEDITEESTTSTIQTPGSSGVKRKSSSPAECDATDTSTGGTTTALGELKIPKMEKL
ncbi:uncharacterized protein [Rutidosis leptorrhynchoides]|uniref:uncharacterized protein n=1 Tax=Rutidosis leptorrhynchoides TaxID=125765 RepID=UPI003A98D54B